MNVLNPAVILVVDDDPFTLTAVAAVLNMSGHECHCARDSEAAMKAVHSLDLDLIICDIDRRGDEGLKLCRDLTRQDAAASVPLVFISSGDSSEHVQRAQQAGGTYHLRKPFEPDQLIELVSNALWMPHLVSQHTGQTQAAPITETAPSSMPHAGKMPRHHVRTVKPMDSERTV